MKTVLLTGANKGIGLELTKKLLSEGFKVIALSKSTNNLEKIADRYLKIYKIDLLDAFELIGIINEIKAEEEHIDILINNAGIGLFKKIEDYTFEEWNKVIHINLTIPFVLIKELLPEMRNRKYGRIINIGSDADSIPFPEAGAYCASKYGLRGMSESIKLDLKKTNVNLTIISPGRVDTYFNGKYPGCRPEALQASDIANQILFVLKQDGRCNVEQIKLKSSLE